MVGKSNMVRKWVCEKNYKKALAVAKDFHLGITYEQSNKMKLAYECMVHERFYLSLGKDIEKSIKEGIEVLVELYGRSEANADNLYQQIC